MNRINGILYRSSRKVSGRISKYAMKVCKKVLPTTYLDLQYKKVDVLTGGMGHVAMAEISKEGKKIITELDGVSDVEKRTELFGKLGKILNRDISAILYHTKFRGIAYINENPRREQDDLSDLSFFRT